MALKERKFLHFIRIQIIFNLFILINNAESNIGFAVPTGDIILEYGKNPLNITCTSYTQGASKNMFFERGSFRFNENQIDILNSTSIRLYINKPPKALGDIYYCMYYNTTSKRDENVAMNTVAVGTPPQNVTDFSCIGYNYEKLECSWTPSQNFVKTDYNLLYIIQARQERYGSPCPSGQPFINTTNNKMSCHWNMSTSPQYRLSLKQLNFYLKSNNTFGENLQTYDFNHFEIVLPNPPINLTAIPVNNTIKLYWIVPPSMKSFPPGLHHRVMYQCEHDKEQDWKFGTLINDKSSLKNKTMQYDLKGIEYGNIFCDIRVSLRSANATSERMWSESASTTVKTTPKIPARPPRTNIGSFEIIYKKDTRDAYVYWQQIRSEEGNGPGLTYLVQVDDEPWRSPEVVSKSYAKFVDLRKDMSYRFKIWSKNSIGKSINYTIVDIPKIYTVPEPIDFQKKTERKGEGENNILYWKRPNSTAIRSYTIFWCSDIRDRPHQCNGNLNWVVVPKDRDTYTQQINGSQIHQFAISANTDHYSSGMQWADCLLSDNNIARVINVYKKQPHSTYLDIGWGISCGYVSGYAIYYCLLSESPEQSECKGKEANITIEGDANVLGTTIRNLKPYSSYRITMSVRGSFDTNGEPELSQLSSPLYFTTLEAAPSTPPTAIQITKVTNSSISLKWKPPTTPNGIIKHYFIKYNHHTMEVDPSQKNATIENLDSYTNYNVQIQACTTECSDYSDPLNITTKMWYPGEIKRPSVGFKNQSLLQIQWERPIHARGKIDWYEVQFKQSKDYDNESGRIEEVKSPSYYIYNCGEDGNYHAFHIAVRAVNVIDGQKYKGNWSNELVYSCVGSSGSIIMIVVITITVAASALIAWLLKKTYVWCKIMRDVEVKLPPGLTPIVDHPNMDPWPMEKQHSEDIDRHSLPADEELLLEKIQEGALSGESSGCSTAHDSVTSSIESTNTHISRAESDSGNEHQLTPVLGDDRRNSLRQRNIANKGYVIMPPPTTDTSQPGHYCVLGLDPTGKPEPVIPYGYVATDMSDMTHDPETSPPFVMLRMRCPREELA